VNRSFQLLQHHADHPAFVGPDQSTVRQPPGMTKLFIFTHPLPSAIILMVGFAVMALVSA
jgi:hypothetical protein